MVLCSCSEGLPYQTVASCPVSTLSCSPRREEEEWRWTRRWQHQRRQTKTSRAARGPKRAEENQAVNQGSVQLTYLSKSIYTQSRWWFCDFKKHFYITSFHFFMTYVAFCTEDAYFVYFVCRRVQRMTKTEPTAQWRTGLEKDSPFSQQRVCSLGKRYSFDSVHNCHLLGH